MLELDVEPVVRAEHPREASGRGGGPDPVAREEAPRELAVPAAGERHEAVGVPREQLVGEARHALRPRQVRGAREPAEARVAGLVPREQHEVRPELPRPDAAQVLAARVAMPGRAKALDRRARRLPCPRGRGGWWRPAASAPAPRDDDAVGIGDRGVEQLDLHPDDGPEPGLARGGREADRAVEALVVGDREAR